MKTTIPPCSDFVVLAKIDKIGKEIVSLVLVPRSLIEGPNRPFPFLVWYVIEKHPVHVLGTWTEVKQWIREEARSEEGEKQ